MIADQARGDGVPQRVRGVFDAGAVHHGGDDLAERAHRHLLARARDPQRPALHARLRAMRDAVSQPFTERRARRATQRHQPPAIALAMTDDQLPRALREPHVLDLERRELADPDAGQHQQLNDRTVAARSQPVGLAL